MKLYNEQNLLFYFLFIIAIVSCGKKNTNKKQIFQCGVDMIKTTPIPAKNVIPLKNKNIIKKRELDSDGFKDFNIYLDLENFNKEIEKFHLDDKRELFVEGMQKAVKTLKLLLKVKPIEKNYGFYDENLIDLSINYWNGTAIGNTSKGMKELGIDLYIFVRFGNKTEMGEYTLASASSVYLIPESGQPLVGIANINREVDYSKAYSKEYFESIILHEFIHILGFSNKYFTKYFHNIENKTDEYNVERFYINSSKVLEIAKKYFNCTSIKGIQLEESGGQGTVGSHWEERILLGDIMNGVIYPEEQVISEFTLALLEDSGYYKANYYTGGLMKFGKNKGCQFLDSKCLNDGKVNPKFKNEFFENIDTEYSPYDPGCTSGRQSRAYHAIYIYSSIPVQYQYFSNETYGGRSSADFCPVSQEESDNNAYYIGHCSTKGSGEYGTKIQYIDSEMHPYNYKNGDLTSDTGEILSNNSFCALSSLISENSNNCEQKSKLRAVCYKMHCSERSLTIEINNNFIVCPRSGGKVKALNFVGYLLCPDYYLICSGTSLCNNMFDCVEQKSELKSDINYDYEIKTSQDISDAEEEEFSEDAYELSDNGFCPKNCLQCNELHQCLKCKTDHRLTEIIENEETKRICKLESELATGYYINNNIYYKCMENCGICSNNNDCTKCKTDYTFENGKCIIKSENCEEYDDNGQCTKCISNYKNVNGQCFEEIENCQDYENNGLCKECETGFAFEEDDRTTCKDKTKFLDEYYTKDDGISYKKCDGEGEDRISNCEKCNYDINLICTKCKTNYILINDTTNTCYPLYYNTDNKYYFQDEYHLRSCSYGINNCEKCQKNNDDLICLQCIADYVVFNDVCYKKIENCEKYGEEELCEECNTDFAFEEDDRTTCKEKTEFSNEYYTKDNGKSYYKCDGGDEVKNIKNCLKCNYINEELTCIECQDQFTFLDNDKKKCYDINNYMNNNRYYLEETKHYKTCSKNKPNCEKCKKTDNKINCIECQNNYRLLESNNACSKKIENCENYNENDPELCIECSQGYGFKGDNTNKCVNITEFDLFYFTLDDNKYFECSDSQNEGIDNCLKCEKKEEGINCIQCKDEFIIIDNENNCTSKTNIENNKYFYEDDHHAKSCSSAIENCQRCIKDEQEKINCIECDTSYFIVNNNPDENNICSNHEPDGEYYVDNNQYFKCISYNSINHCQYCQDKDSCDKCLDGYAFINEDKLSCNSIANLGNHYIKDDVNGIIYKQCSEYIDNCDTCTEKTKCLTCKSGFSLINDYSLCINLTERKYYLNEEDGIYYICENGVSNCEKCSSDSICIKCKEGYIKLNNDKSVCYDMDEVRELIEDNKYYLDPNDNNNYLICSNFVQNCENCYYPQGCYICQSGFIILNDNYKTCYNKSNTDLKYYYTYDNKTYYSCKDYRFKNDISCFTKIPKQNITLTFVQVQIVNKKLVCYMITHSPLPKDFSLKLKIIINNIQNNQRLLTDNIQEVILTTTDDSYGIVNTIVSFISDEEFNSEENEIIVKEIDFNKDNSLTKTVFDNNICSLEYEKYSELLNTYKVKQKIKDKKVPDLSSFQQDNIVNLNFDKSDGCELSLNSENPVSFSNKNLDIDLIQSDNNAKQITAKCNTKSQNIQNIKCKISDEVNDDYNFKSRLISDADNIITLNSNKEKFRIFCDKSSSSNSNKKTIIIVIYVICAIVLVAITLTMIFIYKKKRNTIKISSNISNPSKSLFNRRNIMTTSVKLNTETVQEKGETADALNINIKNKRRKSKSSSKQRKSSREKDKKIKNKNENEN